MALGVYNGAGSGITLGLYHLENTTDASGNGNTLTNTGSVAFNPAKFGNGADFGSSGNSKRLTTANALGWNGGNITMSCWAKLNAEITSSYYVFLNIEHVTTRSAMRMFYDYGSGTRRLYFGRTKLGVADNILTYNLTMGTSNWYHFLMTFDGSNCRIYVNGALVGTVASSGNGTFTSFSDAFNIGNTGTTYLNGHMVDLTFIQNRVWSASEIQKYYTYAKGRFGII
jgi:hypothetical protein